METENLLHSPAVVIACFGCQSISPVYNALITSLLCVDFLQRDWISPPAKEVTYVSAFCLHLERYKHVYESRNAETVLHKAGPDNLTFNCEFLTNSILVSQLVMLHTSERARSYSGKP